MGCGTSSEAWINYRITEIDNEIRLLQKERGILSNEIQRKELEKETTIVAIPKVATKVIKDINEVAKDITIITLLSDRNNCHAPISHYITHSSDGGGSGDSDDSD